MGPDSKAYRGVNTVALWVAAGAKQYAQGIWGTYRQWQDREAQVRKGEKSSLVIFYKEFDSGDATPAGDDETGERRFVARASQPTRLLNIWHRLATANNGRRPSAAFSLLAIGLA
jgi:antirestriction protein ArdC